MEASTARRQIRPQGRTSGAEEAEAANSAPSRDATEVEMIGGCRVIYEEPGSMANVKEVLMRGDQVIKVVRQGRFKWDEELSR